MSRTKRKVGFVYVRRGIKRDIKELSSTIKSLTKIKSALKRASKKLPRLQRLAKKLKVKTYR